MTDNSIIVDQAAIDRLVDGELDNAERRALLIRLETTPNGWRRCALAFLETQEIRTAFGSPSRETAIVAKEIPVELAAQDRTNTSRRNTKRWPMIAALTICAFAAGIGAGRALVPRSVPTASSESEKRESQIVTDDAPTSHAPAPSKDNVAAPATKPAPAEKKRPRSSEVRVVGLVRIADESANVSNYVMPVYSGAGLDQEWLKTMPLPYNDEQVNKWKADGYNVEQRRQLMEVSLSDGQNLAIPFGTVNLQYVGDEVR